MTSRLPVGSVRPLLLGVSVLLFLPAVSCTASAPGPTHRGTAHVNGTTLYFEARGTGDPVILIHGGQLDRRMWDEQFEVLAQEHRVIRYDVRGYGKSGTADEPFAAHEDLHALLRYLGIERAHLVGLSLGGRIAVDFALEHPEMVDRLVLAGPGLSGWQWSAKDHAFFAGIEEAAETGNLGRAVELWLASPYMAPAMEDERLADRLRQLALDNTRVWREPSQERELEPPAAGRLSEITAPTLLIIGSRDVPDIHAIVDALESSVPGARRVSFEGAGHMVNMERPDAFNKAVLDFLAGPTPGRPGGARG